MSGKDFNGNFPFKQFWKLTNETECHNGLQYFDGYVEDCVPFNPYGTSEPGGMYFIERDNIEIWKSSNHFYKRKVTIPPDAKVYIEAMAFKTDKFILGKAVPLSKKNKKENTDDNDNDQIEKVIAYDHKSSKQFIMPQLCDSPLRFVSRQTAQICQHYVERNGMAIEYVNPHFHTEALCKIAVTENGMALQHVFPNMKTKEICLLAVQNNGYALEYIPGYNAADNSSDIEKNKLVLRDFYRDAVISNGLSLCLIQKNNRTDELCELAVNENGWALMYVPTQTKKLCKIAVRQNCDILEIVDKELLKPAKWYKINSIYREALKSSSRYNKNKKWWSCF